VVHTHRLPGNLVAHHPGYLVVEIYIGNAKITKVTSDRVIKITLVEARYNFIAARELGIRLIISCVTNITVR
jgi:hypothetical protein